MSIDSISAKRLFFYLSVLLLFPIVLIIQHFSSAATEIENIEEMLSLLEGEILNKEKKQAENKAVRALYKDSDHFYIDKYLEPLPLLQKEISSIETLFEKPVPLSEPLKKRYDHLTNQNAIRFVEGQVKSYPTFQETIETLSHPVEVDLDDLKTLLTLIEGSNLSSTVPEGRPHLLITDLKLDKKEGLNNREHFQLSLKLLKREYL